MTPLDNPVWHALAGPQARFARSEGRAHRYDPEVALFCGLPDDPRPDDWADLAALVTGNAAVFFAVRPLAVPASWKTVTTFASVQMVATRPIGDTDAAVVRLGSADVPEMLDLVARTEPGPFLARTHELGSYVGIRENGRLVALAGERMHFPGHTEISAVCTDPAFRGRGLARRLVRTVAAGIEARGETPMLHARADNDAAIGLYSALGFAVRTEFGVVVVRALGIPGADRPLP